jgi:hypothetical protein
MAIDPWREQNKKAKSGLPSMCEVLDLTASVAERQTDRQIEFERDQAVDDLQSNVRSKKMLFLYSMSQIPRGGTQVPCCVLEEALALCHAYQGLW